MQDDLEPRSVKAAITLGTDVSTLSIDELGERIAACESEIARLRAAIDAKQRSAASAENFFRR